MQRGQRGPEPEAGPAGEATAHLCTRLGVTWTLGTGPNVSLDQKWASKHDTAETVCASAQL